MWDKIINHNKCMLTEYLHINPILCLKFYVFRIGKYRNIYLGIFQTIMILHTTIAFDCKLDLIGFAHQGDQRSSDNIQIIILTIKGNYWKFCKVSFEFFY